MAITTPISRFPSAGRFHYSRAEIIADGVVHAVGIVLAIAAGSALLSLAVFHAGPGEYVAAIFYVVSLLTVLSISLAYNLWPLTPAKWILRRFDHAAIYLLIAATYTPFLAQLDDAAVTGTMIAVVWGAAVAGMAIKLFLPGRFDRLAVVFYLAMGWSGMVVISTAPRDAAARDALASSSPAASSIRAASCFSSGGDCASRTRCGTVSWSPAPACICAAVIDCLVIARF